MVGHLKSRLQSVPLIIIIYNVQATAGLDGAVIIYDFVSDYDLRVRSYIQVRSYLVELVFIHVD